VGGVAAGEGSSCYCEPFLPVIPAQAGPHSNICRPALVALGRRPALVALGRRPALVAGRYAGYRKKYLE
jgi:hypothetical protein